MEYSRKQILEDYIKTEADVLSDEKGDYIVAEKWGTVENDRGTAIDVLEGHKRIDLPAKVYFKDSNDLFMEEQEKQGKLEAKKQAKAIYDEKTGEYLGQRK